MRTYRTTVTFFLSIFLSFSAKAFDDFDEFFGPEPPPSAEVNHFIVVLIISCLILAHYSLNVRTKKVQNHEK